MPRPGKFGGQVVTIFHLNVFFVCAFSLLVAAIPAAPAPSIKSLLFIYTSLLFSYKTFELFVNNTGVKLRYKGAYHDCFNTESNRSVSCY